MRNLADGDLAVGFFNLSDSPADLWVTEADLGISFRQNKTLEGTEVYTGRKLRSVNATLSASLAPHTCEVYRMKIVNL